MKPKLSPEFAELVGIIIGDGYLYTNGTKYIIGIVGNPKTDWSYFRYIKNIITELFDVNPSIRVGGQRAKTNF